MALQKAPHRARLTKAVKDCRGLQALTLSPVLVALVHDLPVLLRFALLFVLDFQRFACLAQDILQPLLYGRLAFIALFIVGTVPAQLIS